MLRLNEETYASMTPFKQYLSDNGLFDDTIYPPIFESDTILEPADLCSDVGCEGCAGYWKDGDQVTRCTCECHKKPVDREVPFDHCRYLGCENCSGLMIDNTVTSHCTCEHHTTEAG
jgi:hypothetical protein